MIDDFATISLVDPNLHLLTQFFAAHQSTNALNHHIFDGRKFPNCDEMLRGVLLIWR